MFEKRKKIMITAIIFLAIIIASPLIYTNINNNKTKNEEVARDMSK